MTDRSINLGGDSPYRVEDDLFDLYDGLPQPLREMLAFAPYPYTLGEVSTYYNRLRGAGMDEARAVQEVKGKFLAMVQRQLKSEVNRVYGPDHPQAA